MDNRLGSFQAFENFSRLLEQKCNERRTGIIEKLRNYEMSLDQDDVRYFDRLSDSDRAFMVKYAPDLMNILEKEVAQSIILQRRPSIEAIMKGVISSQTEISIESGLFGEIDEDLVFELAGSGTKSLSSKFSKDVIELNMAKERGLKSLLGHILKIALSRS
jgi:lysyl-tRNA synthetase class I